MQEDLFLLDRECLLPTLIHVRVRQRTTKKRITSIEELDTSDKNYLSSLSTILAKKLACNSWISEGIIYLQGDHVRKVSSLLIKYGEVDKRAIRLHTV